MVPLSSLRSKLQNLTFIFDAQRVSTFRRHFFVRITFGLFCFYVHSATSGCMIGPPMIMRTWRSIHGPSDEAVKRRVVTTGTDTPPFVLLVIPDFVVKAMVHL